jgi:hypothetical protein
MKIGMLRTAAVAAIVLLGASVAAGAEVSQGKCLSFDKEKMVLTMEEYDIRFSPEHPYGRPTGVKTEYRLRNAQMGIPPRPGDVVRIAYEVKGTDRVAVRLMNVTQQDLMKK